MRKHLLSTLGSVGTAFMSTVCCVGPLALSALGLGSGTILTQLAPFRPYWIGLSVILLGLSFYLTYRPRKVVCADGTCKIERAGRWNKIAIWSGAVAIALLIALPYGLGTLATQTTSSSQIANSAEQTSTLPPSGELLHDETAVAANGSQDSAVNSQVTQAQPPAATETINKLTLTVSGMSCPACPLTVKSYLSRVPGVQEVTVQLQPPKAEVIYDASKTEPAKIIAALKEPYCGQGGCE